MSRHRNSNSNPGISAAPPSASAATAAAKAFLNNRASNASLSAAAAAAALRSHTTSPISVGGVQTKRTIRRQNSVTSNGSAAGSVSGLGGRGFVRQTSSGSMSERSFRNPSPRRAVTPDLADATPPVPALPGMAPSMNGSYRRAVSIGTPSRAASAPLGSGVGRGTSLDRRGASSTGGGTSVHRAASLTSVEEQEQEAERDGSPESINFSRPMGMRDSPPSSPTPKTQGSLNRNLAAYFGADARAGANKKKVTSQASSLKNDVTGRESVMKSQDRSKATLTESNAGDSASITPFPTAENSHFPAAPGVIGREISRESIVSTQERGIPSAIPAISSHNSGLESIVEGGDDERKPQSTRTRNNAVLVEQPSMVRGDKVLEVKLDQRALTRSVNRANSTLTPTKGKKASEKTGGPPSNAPPSAVAPSPFGQSAFAAITTASNGDAESRQKSRSSTQPAPLLADAPRMSSPTDDAGSSSLTRDFGSLRTRPQSLSPARVAHFSRNPSAKLPIAKHDPPQRSLSPAKSAMKQSPSPRGGSPAFHVIADRRPNSFHASSQESEPMSIPDDGPRTSGTARRKKSVRVSFDEEPVVVPNNGGSTPTSPMTPVLLSPQHQSFANKRSSALLSEIQSGMRHQPSTFSESDQDDQTTLQPRPALPSFGSVRNRRDLSNSGEDQKYSLDTARRAMLATTYTNVPPNSINASNRHVARHISSQEYASRSDAQPQDTPTVPDASISGLAYHQLSLPPEVTSVDGSGFASDSDEGSSTEDSRRFAATRGSVTAPALLEASDRSGEIEGRLDPADITLPSIELIVPTPTLEQTYVSQNWLSGTQIGSEDESYDKKKVDNAPIEHYATGLTPASVGIAEPEPEESMHAHSPGLLAVGDVAETLRHQTEGIMVEEGSEDDSGASIYSDAAEDLSDLEGDGFLSIDAVVESPVTNSRTAGLAIITPPGSPMAQPYKTHEILRSRAHATPGKEASVPAANEGWGEAQAYWSSLSDNKKAQIEQDALPEGSKVEQSVDSQVKAAVVKTKKKRVVPKHINSTANDSLQPAEEVFDDARLPPGSDQPDSIAIKTKAAGPKATKKGTVLPTRPKSDDAFHLPKTMRVGPVGDRTMRGAQHLGREASRSEDTNAASTKAITIANTMANNGTKDGSKTSRPSSTPMDSTRTGSSAITEKELEKMPSLVGTPAELLTRKKQTVSSRPLTNIGSNESDSSASVSSFRKQRRLASTGFTMRTTMRGSSLPADHTLIDRRPGSPDISAEPVRSSRFSLRSLSPAGSAFRKSFTPQPAVSGLMRTSMRGSASSTSSTRRSETRNRTKSPSRFSGFHRTSKPTASVEMSRQQRPRARPSSRFADSSDEDDGGAHHFRSRFSDSSDEDGSHVFARAKAPSHFTPVRGIPRRIGEQDGQSTDLADSSEDETPSKPMAIKPLKPSPALATHPIDPGQGTTLVTGNLRQSRGTAPELDRAKAAATPPAMSGRKKRSFFGVLGRRKDSSAKAIMKPVGESGARRDTPLERTRADLQSTRIRQNSPQRQMPAPPASPAISSNSVRPKLVKKNTQRSYTSAANWPLTSPPPATPKGSRIITSAMASARPATADGTGPARTSFFGGGMNNRPLIGDRRSTATSPGFGSGRDRTRITGLPGSSPPGAGNPNPGEEFTQRKKKFPRLRKAFGLHD